MFVKNKATPQQLAKLRENLAIIEKEVDNAPKEFPMIFRKNAKNISQGECAEIIVDSNAVIDYVRKDQTLLVSKAEKELIEGLRLLKFGRLGDVGRYIQALIES